METILFCTLGMRICRALAENLFAMSALFDWCNQNILNNNLNKTKHMIVGKNCKTDLAIPSIKLNGMNIENVHSFNYLGVIKDDRLIIDDILDAKYNLLQCRY